LLVERYTNSPLATFSSLAGLELATC